MKITDKRTKQYRDIRLLLTFILGVTIAGFGTTGYPHLIARAEERKANEWQNQQLPLHLSPFKGSCQGFGCVIDYRDYEGLESPEQREIRVKNEQDDYFINLDVLMGEAINKYFKTPQEISRIKPIAHCLLRNESGYYLNKGMGDNGKAGGILQFHEPTYIANRNRMIKLGLADHLGSRFNEEDAIDTAVWMWSIGELKQWGPWVRGECR